MRHKRIGSRTVQHAMVEGQAQIAHGPDDDGVIRAGQQRRARGADHRALDDCAHAQNPRLRLIEDRRPQQTPADAVVGDRKRAAAGRIGRKLVAARLLSQFVDRPRQPRQRALVGVADHRHDQPLVHTHRHADMDTRVQDDGRLFPRGVIAGVHGRFGNQRLRRRGHEIGRVRQPHPAPRILVLVRLAMPHHRGHVYLKDRRHMRASALALHHVLGNHPAHGRQRLPHLVRCGCRHRSGNGRSGNRLGCNRSRGHIPQHVLLGHATVHPRPQHIRQFDGVFGHQFRHDRADKRAPHQSLGGVGLGSGHRGRVHRRRDRCPRRVHRFARPAHIRQHGPGAHGAPRLDQHRQQRPVRGARHFRIDLVRVDLQQRFQLGDAVPRRFEPARHGPFDHAFAHLGHRYGNRHRLVEYCITPWGDRPAPLRQARPCRRSYKDKPAAPAST